MGEADRLFLAQLRECALVAPGFIEGASERLGGREDAGLTDLLLAAADRLDERAWIAWLIRRHGCRRLGAPRWMPSALSWMREKFPADGNVAFARCRDGADLVAVMRPDRMAGPQGSGPTRVRHWCAASPGEVLRLRQERQRWIERGYL